MTASTRTVTLSRVMPSCAGTGIVIICMFTFCEAISDRHQHRESRTTDTGLDPSETEDDAAFELLHDAKVSCEPEQKHGSRSGQCIDSDHGASIPPEFTSGRAHQRPRAIHSG